MKRVLCLLLCMVMVLSLSACKKDKEEEQETTYTYEIGMLTASPEISIDDGNYTEAVWEGVRRFADGEGVTYKYYEPAEAGKEAQLKRLDEALGEGVKVVVAAGPEMKEAVAEAQTKYPDVTFIYIDGKLDAPEVNAVAVSFNPLQAGFLAGYGAVVEGLDDLGFLAQGETEEARAYGYGFLQGANTASMRFGRYAVINYSYGNDSWGETEIRTKAKEWYGNGTDAIFTYGPEAFDAVKAEASASKKAVIGSNYGQEYSKTAITTAEKYYEEAVYNQLQSVYDGSFEGGKNLLLGLKSEGVGLDMKASKFQYFNQDMYKDICKEIVNGDQKILSYSDAKTIDDLVKAQWMYYIRIEQQ